VFSCMRDQSTTPLRGVSTPVLRVLPARPAQPVPPIVHRPRMVRNLRATGPERSVTVSAVVRPGLGSTLTPDRSLPLQARTALATGAVRHRPREVRDLLPTVTHRAAARDTVVRAGLRPAHHTLAAWFRGARLHDARLGLRARLGLLRCGGHVPHGLTSGRIFGGLFEAAEVRVAGALRLDALPAFLIGGHDTSLAQKKGPRNRSYEDPLPPVTGDYSAAMGWVVLSMGK